MEPIYPAGPAHVPTDLTQPSKQYRQRAWLAMGSLLLFGGIYFALMGWFGWTAYRLIRTAYAGEPNLGLLLSGLAAGFLCFFMLKALFFIRRGGAPDEIELVPSEQPALFAFLHQLADEAGAPRPARVYVSARVNAAVFYDLSILNFIFPSRKNLEIGLALVNVLTLSEFKAVLAHEFGHFAQRSMAIGTWVYIAQQIAAQIVTRRDAMDHFMQGISRADLRIAWAGWALSLVVWSIRSLLDTLYRVVVLAQRALSRQMEFQADLVAVSLTGSDELIHALHKLQSADDAWSKTLDFANAEAQAGRAVRDFFAVQTAIISKTAHILDDADYGQVPTSKGAQARVFNSGFAQPPKMWSTHPDNADRETNAKRQYLSAPHDARSGWEVFTRSEQLREQVSGHLLKAMQLEVAEPETTQQRLDERYGLEQYAPAYRGVYLGRALTRCYQEPQDLYVEEVLAQADVQAALAELYPATLKDELAQLRELEEEKAMLEAVRDKRYQAAGNQLVYRGKELARRELPAAIREVAQEVEAVRARILAHDRKCRATHLALADQLGQGWGDYLRGLIAVLHYAEHSSANLQDAQGLLHNVTQIVTADGKVSKAELKRLLGVAHELYGVLDDISEQKNALLLDTMLLVRLKSENWASLLPEFKLPPASETNINQWMQSIDGWVSAFARALSMLRNVALEQLLSSEAQLAKFVAGSVDDAPAASCVPAKYARLLLGQERKRQQRLDLWSRFQTADGVLPAVGRVLVAIVIVGAVLSMSYLAGATSDVSIYNGLDTQVQVKVGDKQISLVHFDSTTLEVQDGERVHVEAHDRNGALIEQFDVSPVYGKHYVYNVASASPLVRWVAVYGRGFKEPDPEMLGTERWRAADVDVYFAEPPRSIKTQGNGGTRSVIDGGADRAPKELLGAVDSASQRVAMVRAHVRWDDPSSAHLADWQALASQLQ